MKILIVDDNSKIRSMMRSFLHEITEDFSECEDGSQALELYADFLPDWVLMDWEMKDTDGLTATRQIIKKFPAANVLLITQYDDDFLRVAAAEAGARGFLLKDELFSLREIVTNQRKF